MPKTIQTEVFTYDELTSEAAKEKARLWWTQGDNFEAEFAFEQMQQDAERIGLKLISLSDTRPNEGYFIESANVTAEKIFSSHGEQCKTFKTAKAFEAANDALPEQITNLEEESRNADALDEIEATFLCSLLEDYRVMLDQEIEFQMSLEQVEESLRANGYTFTADGKRFG